MNRRLIQPPVVERRAEIPAGTVFAYGGRQLMVTKSYGTDNAAPVIVEELTDRYAIKGQYALWSLDCVRRAVAGRTPGLT
jgi:hypothetical protein